MLHDSSMQPSLTPLVEGQTVPLLTDLFYHATTSTAPIHVHASDAVVCQSCAQCCLFSWCAKQQQHGLQNGTKAPDSWLSGKTAKFCTQPVTSLTDKPWRLSAQTKKTFETSKNGSRQPQTQCTQYSAAERLTTYCQVAPKTMHTRASSAALQL
jgi:hypothetical protein